MNLGRILRERRKAMALTLDTVAEAADISKPYLSTIETGRVKNPPSDGVLESLEEILQFEPGELIRLAHLQRTPDDVRREHAQLESQLRELDSFVRGLVARGPRDDVGQLDLDAVCEQLGIENHGELLTAGASVPVINRVEAGYPQDFGDLDYPAGVADEYIRVPEINDPQAFATRVVGESMQPKYHQGDIVVFSPNTPPRNGDDCFVRFTPGEGTTFKRYYHDDEQTIRLQPLNNVYPAKAYRTEQITGLWPAVFRIEKLRSN